MRVKAMGKSKRPASSRKLNMPKATNPSSESSQTQPPNASLELTELQHENASPPHEKTNSKLGMEEKSAKPSHSRKRQKHYNTPVRRSLRIQNGVTPVQNQNTEHVIENINISESEKEDEESHEQLDGPILEEPFPEPNLAEKSMEEKIDYMVQLLETLNSKMCNQAERGSPVFHESPDLRYKSLYIDSQKKIEALMEQIDALKDENRELSLKQEAALGKLEGFEKGTRAFSEVMEKLKDVVVASSLSKAADTVVNPSSQGGRDALSPQVTVQDSKVSAKRKKQP